MAAISFPTMPQAFDPAVGYVENDPPQPTDNQYSFSGSVYQFDTDNNRWLAQQSGGASVTVSQVPPAMASDGDLWWYCGADDEDPSLFTYVDDATGVGSWIQSSPGIAFDSSSTGETGVTTPETAADFEIARNFTFPTSTHSGTTTFAGSGEIDWLIAGTVSVNEYIGMGMSQLITFVPPFVYAAGDWVDMSNTLTYFFRTHSSQFTVSLNGIAIDTTQAGPVGTGSQSSAATVTATGGGYITQAMIDAGDGNPDNDIWTYNLTDSGGNSSANGSVIIYADSRL